MCWEFAGRHHCFFLKGCIIIDLIFILDLTAKIDIDEGQIVFYLWNGSEINLGTMAEIRVGCSGWSYKDWIGPFYPEGTDSSDMLSHYLRKFDTVEINSTFYGIPNKWVVKNWLEKSPDEFRFSAKMVRDVTHENELDSVKSAYSKYMVNMLPLKSKMGSILVQMPQRFKASDANYDLLEDFLAMLHEDAKFTMEFRHRSWFDSQTFKLLGRYNVAFCVVSQPQFKGLIPPEAVVTANHAYIRFHGLNYKKWYAGNGNARYDYLYSKKELRDWKPKIEEVQDEASDTVYVYFNNHPAGQAPKNAKMMMDLLGVSPRTPDLSGESEQKRL